MKKMKENNAGNYQYQPLGKRLKVMREKLRESLAEVSGAVEIEIDTLNNIELGAERPSEDILMLLISYFGIKEEEASQLWELGQYEQPQQLKDNIAAKQGIVVMPGDVRIAYTDVAHTSANQYGIVINFMQESGPAGQPLIISRVGMSKEHAKSLVQVLQQTLQNIEPKALPAPKRISKRQNKTDHQ